MDTINGIYELLEGNTSHLASNQIQREIAWDTTISALVYKSDSGTLFAIRSATDHLLLENIGTNSHLQIDAFIASKNQANGLAGLDANGKVPTGQLPSYVDDVLEYANLAGFPVTGESGKIYLAIDTNSTYRWTGVTYAKVGGSDLTAPSGQIIYGNTSNDGLTSSDRLIFIDMVAGPPNGKSLHIENAPGIRKTVIDADGVKAQKWDNTNSIWRTKSQLMSYGGLYIAPSDETSTLGANITYNGIDVILTNATGPDSCGLDIHTGSLYKINGSAHRHDASTLDNPVVEPSGQILYGTGTGVDSSDKFIVLDTIVANDPGLLKKMIITSSTGAYAEISANGVVGMNSANNEYNWGIISADDDLLDSRANGYIFFSGHGQVIPNMITAIGDGSFMFNGPLDIPSGEYYKINGVPHTHDDISLLSDGNGVVSGMAISIGSPTSTFTVASGTYHKIGTAIPVSYTGVTNQAVTYINTWKQTYIGLNTTTGTITQQQDHFTPSQRRTHVVLGILIHTDNTIINAINNLPDVAKYSLSQLNDFMEEFGPFNINGNIISANGANLKINKSFGELFKRGINFGLDPTDPHTKDMDALDAPTDMRMRMSNSIESANTDSINIQYESAPGVLSSISSGKYGVFRVVLFPSNLIRIQYPQFLYNSIDEARDAINTEEYVTEPNIAANGLTRAFIIIRGGTTALNDIDNVKFLPADKFGYNISSGGGSGSITTLQGAYVNSIEPEITTNNTLGAFTIKNGQTDDTANQLEIKNIAGNITAYIKGDGTNNLYTLPIATASVLGGIKIGTGLSIDSGTGIVSTTTSVVTLQDAYDNSTNPWITINDTLGAVIIDRGLATDTSLLQIIGNDTTYVNFTTSGMDLDSTGRLTKDTYRFFNEYNGNETTYYSYDEATQTYTFNSGGTSTYLIDGVKYNQPANTTTVTHGIGIQVHFIYINASNQLVTSTTAWNLADSIVPLLAIYWTGTKAIPIFECHNKTRDRDWHANAHTSIGTQSQADGFGLSNINQDSATTDAQLLYGIGEGWLKDEDIKLTLDALPSGGTSYNILYRNAAGNTDLEIINKAVPFQHGATYISYNNINTGTFVESTTGRWVNYFVVAIPVKSSNNGNIITNTSHPYRFVYVPGQASHSSLSAAQAEEFWSLNLGDLANFSEWTPLYRITYRVNSSFTTTYNIQVDEWKRYYESRASITGFGSTTTVHNALTGRTTADAHPITAITGTIDNLAAFDVNGNGTSIAKSTFSLSGHDHSGTYLTTVTGDSTSRTANTVYAAPNGSAGTATFRALVALDLPDLSGTYSTISHVHTMGSLTSAGTAGLIPFSNGSTLINSSNLVWDNATNKLGVGKAVGNYRLEVLDTIGAISDGTSNSQITSLIPITATGKSAVVLTSTTTGNYLQMISHGSAIAGTSCGVSNNSLNILFGGGGNMVVATETTHTLTLGTKNLAAITIGTDQYSTFNSKLITAASTIDRAGFNIPQGVAPSNAYIEGDFWRGANDFTLYMRRASSTYSFPFIEANNSWTGNQTSSGTMRFDATVTCTKSGDALTLNGTNGYITGKGYRRGFATKTGAATLTTGDDTVSCTTSSASYNITLPAPAAGMQYTIIKSEASITYPITIVTGTPASQYINATLGGTYVLDKAWETVTLIGVDSTHWAIIPTESIVLSKTLVIEAPVNGENITFFRTSTAITVLAVTSVITGSTSVTYSIKTGTSRATAGTTVVNAVLTNNTTNGASDTITTAAIPAGSWIWLETSGAVGSPTSLSIELRYMET